MKIFKALVFLIIISSTISCENEVDINSNGEETTLIYGLLDKNADTQLVKINRTFLDDKISALDLAKDGSVLNYDSLNVSLINEKNSLTIPLEKITLPKKAGIFTSSENILYYTTAKLLANETYMLEVIKPDGSKTTGKTTVIDTVNILEPDVRFGPNLIGNAVRFTNFRGTAIDDFTFEFRAGRHISEFEVKMSFIYIEETINGDFRRAVSYNVGKIDNPNFGSRTSQGLSSSRVSFSGDLFFREIENQVAPSINPTKKIIPSTGSIEIEISAADGDYGFYRDLNGPIDGLAQVRPEFTNVENGIGLFASRFSMIAISQLNQETRNFLIQNYRSTRNFSSE